MDVHANRNESGIQHLIEAGMAIPLKHVELRSRIQRLVVEVSNAANADVEGLKLLFRLAEDSTSALTSLAENNPSKIQMLAETRHLWPVLVSTGTASAKSTADFLKRIGLARRTAIPISIPTIFTSPTTARRYVLEAVAYIQFWRSFLIFDEETRPPDLTHTEWLISVALGANADEHQELLMSDGASFLKVCLKLPDFSKNTFKAWYPLVREYILHVTEGHPEKIPELRILGLHKKDKYVSAPSSKRSKAGSIEANIRDGIFTQISQAMEAMAPKSSP